jgi:hypothetical protein
MITMETTISSREMLEVVVSMVYGQMCVQQEMQLHFEMYLPWLTLRHASCICRASIAKSDFSSFTSLTCSATRFTCHIHYYTITIQFAHEIQVQVRFSRQIKNYFTYVLERRLAKLV